MLQAAAFVNVVIGKIGKLVHKRICSHDLFFLNLYITLLFYKLNALLLKQKKLSVLDMKKLSFPFLYPGVPAGLTPFRGLVPLGRRNLVPILSRHTLYEGGYDIIGLAKGSLQVKCITIETKEVVRFRYNGFLFPHSYSGEGFGAAHLSKQRPVTSTCISGLYQ
jgi:hypothetical protein